MVIIEAEVFSRLNSVELYCELLLIAIIFENTMNSLTPAVKNRTSFKKKKNHIRQNVIAINGEWKTCDATMLNSHVQSCMQLYCIWNIQIHGPHQ